MTPTTLTHLRAAKVPISEPGTPILYGHRGKVYAGIYIGPMDTSNDLDTRQYLCVEGGPCANTLAADCVVNIETRIGFLLALDACEQRRIERLDVNAHGFPVSVPLATARQAAWWEDAEHRDPLIAALASGLASVPG